jgi:hypothetical protein
MGIRRCNVPLVTRLRIIHAQHPNAQHAREVDAIWGRIVVFQTQPGKASIKLALGNH